MFGKNILAVLLGIAVSAAYAQTAEIPASSISVRADFVDAPRYEGGRGYPNFPQQSFGHPAKWLQILVSYMPRQNRDEAFLEDFNVTASVLVPANYVKNSTGPILLEGKQELWKVPQDGRTHHVLFVVPPYYFRNYTTISKFSAKAAQSQVYCAAVLRSGTQVLGMGFSRVQGVSYETVRSEFAPFYAKEPQGMILRNAVLPKDKSPWQWLDADNFDLPKSMMEGNK